MTLLVAIDGTGYMANDGLVSKVIAIGTFSSCHSHSLCACTVYS